MLFSEYYDIDKKEELSFLDVLLDVDIPYFIDPRLLRTTTVPEFENAWTKLADIFGKVLISLKNSSRINDPYWNAAERLICYKEISGTGLGYSRESHEGNAIGKKLRKEILMNLKDLVIKGETDPVLFELVCVFERNISFDRLSDLLTALLIEEISDYSERIFRQYNLETSDCTINGLSKRLLKNPYKGKETILLLPKEFLSPFPLVFEMSDLETYNVVKNEILDEYMKLFGFAFKKSEEKTRDNVRDAFYKDKNFRSLVIEEYRERELKSYDFNKDPAGLYSWYENSKKAVEHVPLSKVRRVIASEKELLILTFEAIELFKNFVEDKGGWRLLYNEDKPRSEESSQLLFYGVVSHYCDRINVDLNREANNGRGPVDFKLSQGVLKTIIELKLSSNKKLSHAVETQIPIYMSQENIKTAILLIVKVTDTKATNLFINDLENSYSKGKIIVFVVNAFAKKSASTA